MKLLPTGLFGFWQKIYPISFLITGIFFKTTIKPKQIKRVDAVAMGISIGDGIFSTLIRMPRVPLVRTCKTMACMKKIGRVFLPIKCTSLLNQGLLSPSQFRGNLLRSRKAATEDKTTVMEP